MSQGFARAEVFAFPTGVLGYATRTSNDSIITSETDVGGCSVTVTPGAGRTIKVTGYANVRKLTGDGHILGRIYEDSTQIGFWLSQDSISSAADDNDKQGTGFAIIEGDGTEHTYKLTLEDLSGGTSRVLAGTSDTAGAFGPAYIVVEDVTDSDPLVVEQHNDHGRLDGKDGDDHTQYLNDTRHANAHPSGRWERISSAQTIPSGSVTTVIIDGEIHHDDADGDMSFDTGTGIVTFNTAGVYAVHAGIRWEAGSFLKALYISHSSAGVIAGQEDPGGLNFHTASTLYKMSASDTLRIRAQHTKGSSALITADSRTFLAVERLS